MSEKWIMQSIHFHYVNILSGHSDVLKCCVCVSVRQQKLEKVMDQEGLADEEVWRQSYLKLWLFRLSHLIDFDSS